MLSTTSPALPRRIDLHVPALHPAQEQIVSEARRYNVLDCGRRFGKDVLLIDRAVETSLSGERVGWFNPSYPMLQDVWRTLRNTLYPVIRNISAQQHRLELVTGGIIDLWSLDAYHTARGYKYHRAIINEAAFSPNFQEAWESVIRATLADYQGDAWMASTPPEEVNSYFESLYERGQSIEWPNWASWKKPTSENPYIPAEEIEAARQELPTRKFKREFLAEFVKEVQGALWKADFFKRIDKAPDLTRVVVGLDPEAASTEESAETGIIVAGKGPCSCKGNLEQHYFITADRTIRGTPNVWGTNAVTAYTDANADLMVGEVNNGGDMVGAVVKGVADSMSIHVAFKKVHASRGKLTRAEPIALLYEQCVAEGTIIDTARGPVAIEAVTTADMVWTREGLRRVLWSGQTGVKPTVEIHSDAGCLRCTEDHPVYVEGKGFTHAGQVVPNHDRMITWNTLTFAPIAAPPSLGRGFAAVLARLGLGGKKPASPNAPSLFSKGFDITYKPISIFARGDIAAISSYIGLFGKPRMGLYRKARMSITSMATRVTTAWKTLLFSPQLNTVENMWQSSTLRMSGVQCLDESWTGGARVNLPPTLAGSAAKPSTLLLHGSAFAPRPAIHTIGITSVGKGRTLPVYNLTVEDQPEFFANGILVHNCKVHHVGAFPALEDQLTTWIPGDVVSPDRLDALVWALTELSKGGWGAV